MTSVNHLAHGDMATGTTSDDMSSRTRKCAASAGHREMKAGGIFRRHIGCRCSGQDGPGWCPIGLSCWPCISLLLHWPARPNGFMTLDAVRKKGFVHGRAPNGVAVFHHTERWVDDMGEECATDVARSQTTVARRAGGAARIHPVPSCVNDMY